MQYVVVDHNDNVIKPQFALHPSAIIDMELEERGLKKKFFAEQLQISPSQLSDLLHEKRHISANLAIKLERLLGIDAEYWMRVQSAYDIAMARLQLATA